MTKMFYRESETQSKRVSHTKATLLYTHNMIVLYSRVSPIQSKCIEKARHLHTAALTSMLQMET